MSENVDKYNVDGMKIVGGTDAGLDLIAKRAAAEAEAELEASRKPLDFIPWGDRILTKRVEAPTEVKVGSIYVPDKHIEQPLEADVIAVPDGMTSFKVGDRVLMTKYGGVAVKIDGVEYLVLREAEILGRRNRAS